MKRRLAVLMALATMFGATAALSGPASAALPPGNNGNHYGEYSNTNSGNHTGAGSGLGKYDNKRRGLR